MKEKKKKNTIRDKIKQIMNFQKTRTGLEQLQKVKDNFEK
jgi:hypothetical protein